jgi:hypothetical protein
LRRLELLDQKLQNAGEIAKGSDLERIEGLVSFAEENQPRLGEMNRGRAVFSAR